MAGQIIPFPWRERRLSPKQGWAMAERVLTMPISERAEKPTGLCLDDSELLLSVCEVLRSRLETSPANVLEEADFFYRFLDKPKRKVGLFDEREYYLGELALIAGTACRLLFHRDEARRWFDRSEPSFSLAANGLAHIARLAYQRLALAMEERHLEDVLERAPLWIETFESMGLVEDALKCRFLEGAALREMGDVPGAIRVFADICRRAEEQRDVRLTAEASNNLAQFYRVLGNLDEAMVYARKALPLLKQLDNRVGLVKLRWGVGSILREQGKPGEAVTAYREALEEARAVGMRGDVAALHLVLADVMLDAGQDRQAEWEVRAALPIIDEEQMVPEGFAALSLLRNALRYQQVDRQALRDLHGYFGGTQT
jgi:tetratricopeptide (TPR) repeat protein